MRTFLENDLLKVEIDTFGAEVKSVLRKENNREYMWYGNPKYWGRTSPVLFPFVGSLKDKKYVFKGNEYSMSQHGFARDNKFEVASMDEEEIWFSFSSNEETLKKYPFSFRLKVGYRLMGDTLQVLWRVKNYSEEVMYFSIGAHPAFLCPEEKEGYSLYFEGATEIHHHGNDVASGMALREDIVIPLTDNRVKLTNDFFDRCTYMVEGNQTKCVGIENKEGKRIVDVMFDTPLFGMWSPEKKNAPFLCIEPWYGRCDAQDFDGDLTQREYTNTLESGASFEGGYSMKFYLV